MRRLMRPSRMVLALLTAALALTLFAGPAAAEPRSVSKQLPVGDFVELDLVLQAGDHIPWTVVIGPAGAQGSFNIHTHFANGTVQNFEDRNLSGTTQGTFTVPAAATYSWMVQNLRYGGYLDVRIDADTSRPLAMRPGGLPGPPAGAVVVALGLAALGAARMAPGERPAKPRQRR